MFSPSREYQVGLDKSGNFFLEDSLSRQIWSTATTGATRVFLQSDGNLIVKGSQNQGLWSSRTYGNDGAVLILDDGGRIAIVNGATVLWFEGIPRKGHQESPSDSLSFPVRGIFYYPWYVNTLVSRRHLHHDEIYNLYVNSIRFPETWTVNSKPVKFEPTLGLYSSSNPQIARTHIDAMDYAHIDLSIASWWGPETNLDRARMTMFMDESIQMNSTLKWSVYHEQERVLQPSADDLRDDLEYLKKWFTWHPAWARVDGRPVIFVYNEPGCDVAKRWADASNGSWYVVLKLFGSFLECPHQPDDWVSRGQEDKGPIRLVIERDLSNFVIEQHQYGVNGGEPLEYDDFSFSISPGFWRADRPSPETPRVSREKWCANAESMAKSEIPWHLIISFNEAGEGTNIESSPHWASDTKYGDYLDCLHQHPTTRPGKRTR